MTYWKVDTDPVTESDEILHTQIEYSEDGLYYIINGADGYDLSMWTPEKAELDYVTPQAREAREVAFAKAWGFYD